MQELIRETTQLVGNEYARASSKFGPVHNSDHESAAVLCEELEEVREELRELSDNYLEFWNLVKSNADKQHKQRVLKRLKNKAVLAACEAIQVAAMAYKAERTLFGEEEQI